MNRKEEIEKYARECAANQIHCIEIDITHACEWADKTMIEKACEWLLNHNDYQRVLDNGRGIRFDMTQCVMDFRKAMEE